jgi:hypothetical protein
MDFFNNSSAIFSSISEISITLGCASLTAIFLLRFVNTMRPCDQEVTFKDLAEGSGIIKAGYRKIQFWAEQAARHGLQHFWVDTCCIDKSNNVELSEAINSMFRWYRNATKCYVYLADEIFKVFRKARDTKETAGITRLRSYDLLDELDIPATICDAALATSAATGFFDPLSIERLWSGL